jgi:hypothetical protein
MHPGHVFIFIFRRGVLNMTDRFKRGSAPGRARDSLQRPGSFKKGHKKQGGRKRGTANVITREYKDALIEAANQLGSDQKGKDGLVGYLTIVAMNEPEAFCKMLCALL